MDRLSRVVSAAISVAVIAIASAPAHAAVCNPRDRGAKADGITKDTAAIQACIDAVSISGSGVLDSTRYGRVILSGGTFLSAPIRLKRGVDLRIEKDAKLLASPNREDFPHWRFAGKDTVQPFVSAVDTEYVSISGQGIIDGNGQVWWDYVRNVPDSGALGTDHPRPMGVLFGHTRHIRMEGVTLQNSGFW